MDALQRRGRVAGDQLAGLDVARERDERDVRMLDERVADRDAVARDHLEHPRRQHLLRQLGEAKGREGRLLGRLQNLDVPGRERGPELPDDHHQRVVPRGDPRDDPERLAADDRGVALDVLAGRLALERARGTGEEAQVVGRERHLVPGDRERLADVLRLEQRQLLGVLVDHVGELEQQLHPVPRRLVEPVGQRLPGRRDGALDVRLGPARHFGDRLAGRRVQDLHRAAVDCVEPLAADVVLHLGDRHAHVRPSRSAVAARAYSRSARVDNLGPLHGTELGHGVLVGLHDRAARDTGEARTRC